MTQAYASPIVSAIRSGMGTRAKLGQSEQTRATEEVDYALPLT